MKLRGIIIGAIALAAVVAVMIAARRSQRTLVANLPQPVDCINEIDAMVRATQFQQANSATIIARTSGTPSMEPYITGRAWVALRPARLAEIPDGSLICYKPVGNTVGPDGKPLAPGTLLLHVLAARDDHGAIPTGINNAHFENWGRVTDETLIGVAVAVWRFRQ